MENYDVFIAFKPLQFINAYNVSIQSRDCKTIMLLVDSFINAKPFYDRVSKLGLFNKVIFFNTWRSAFKWCVNNKSIINQLYLNTDSGLQIGYYIKRLSKIPIYIYEEGYGNYRGTILSNEKLSHKFFRLLRIAISGNRDVDKFIGSNNNICGLFLYHPNVFSMIHPLYKKSVTKIAKPFISQLAELKDQIWPDFKVNEYSNKNVLLYLSEWQINNRVYDYFDKYHDFVKIIKPHPHILKLTEIQGFDVTLKTEMPAELVIINLFSVANELVVIHESSTSLLYFKSNSHFNIINLTDDNNGEYSRIYSLIQKRI